MKKYFILFAAFCAAAVVSCTPKELVIDTPAEEGVSNVKLIPITITASLEGTKADLAGEKVITWTWKAGDELAVYDGTTVQRFTLDPSADGSTVAKFTGSVTKGFTSLQAVFPYDAAGSSFSTPLIPEVQTIPSGTTIDPKAMIAVAERAEQVADDEFNFYFTSGVSMLRFTVPDGVQKVILHTEGKEAAIAGASRSVTVNVPGAGQYWAAVNPASYEGLKVFSRTSDGDFMKSTTATIDLSAPGKAKNLGTLGTGTQVSVIEDGAELVSYLGSTPTLDAYVVNDLDLTGKTVTTCANFANVFDGLYHSIKNWTSNGVALFGTVKAAGSVNNLTFDDSCSLTNPDDGDFGFMVKKLQGSMANCINYADVSVTFSDLTLQHVFSTIVGRSSSTTSLMTGCINYGNIDIEYTTPTSAKMNTQYFGGVVGLVGTETDALRMSGCRYEADHISIIVHRGETEEQYLNNTYVGGIAGATGLTAGSATTPKGYAKNYGIFSGCVNNADVYLSWEGGTGGYYKVGGIIGVSQAQLLECTNNGDVSLISSTERYNANPSIGGIAGVIGGPSSPNAKDCVNNGTVTFRGSYTNSTSDSAYKSGCLGYYWASAGGCFGVVGDSATLIENCDCNAPVDFDVTMATGGGSGHCLGGIAGISEAELKNCDHICASTSTLSTTAKNGWIGGVAGLAYASVTNCTSNAPINCSRANVSATDKATYLGGIVGRLMNEATISGCSNAGTISLTTGNEHKHVYFAGIVGYSALATISNCSNSNTLSFDGGGETAGQLYMAGIAAYYTSKSKISECSSTGDFTATNWANTNYSYIGGIGGQYSGGSNTITNCTHNADITITTASKLRVGGIGAAANGSFTGNVHSGNISASGMSGGSAAAESQIGGLAGYWGNGNIGRSSTRSCSTSGAITTKLGSNSRTGGVVGSINVNSTWTDITVNHQITTNGSEYVGALVGGFHSDGNLVVTLSGSPVYTGTTVNGAAISSENILGFANNTGSISGFSN